MQINGNTLTIHESYNNNQISDDLKAPGYEAIDTAKYIAGHPKEVADTTYTAAKAIITNPKAIAIGLLGIAIGGSGCIFPSADSAAASNGVPDVPIKAPADEKILKTTPDGLNFFEKESDVYVTNTYRGACDIDNDGDIDAKDSAVDQNDAARHNKNIAIAIRAVYGIQPDSKLHQNYSDIEELRIRQWDFDENDDYYYDKIGVIINDEVVHTTTTDVDQDGRISFMDTLIELGWK